MNRDFSLLLQEKILGYSRRDFSIVTFLRDYNDRYHTILKKDFFFICKKEALKFVDQTLQKNYPYYRAHIIKILEKDGILYLSFKGETLIIKIKAYQTYCPDNKEADQFFLDHPPETYFDWSRLPPVARSNRPFLGVGAVL